MSEYRDEAIKKLQREDAAAKYDRYGQAMHGYIRARLEEFCDQDDEFAQAIVQGGSFEDCMKAVCNKVGQSISDLEAVSRAVNFYFPDKKVLFRMEIVDEQEAAAPPAVRAEAPSNPAKGGGIIIDLGDFL